MGQWEDSAEVAAASAPTVPPGLPELMEGLSREVLRHNPEDIYSFCAQHMEKLIKIRNAVNEKSTPKTPLKQKIGRTQKLVREKSEERQRQYLNVMSTGMTAMTEEANALGRKDSGSKNEGLNRNDKVSKDNSNNNAFCEDNKRERSNELVNAQSIESNGTLDENILKVDNVVEGETSNLATEKLVKEGESLMTKNLLDENVELQEDLSDDVIKESPSLHIKDSADGSKSEINIENIRETNFIQGNEKLVNNNQAGESESSPKEENENITHRKMAENSENLIKGVDHSLPETIEVTETLESIGEITKYNGIIAESLESFPKKTITEVRESLDISTIDEANENLDKNKQTSEGLVEKAMTDINKYSDKITEKDKSFDKDKVMADGFENLTKNKTTEDSQSTTDSTSTTDGSNAIVINENTADKNQNLIEEFAVQESKSFTYENIGKTNESGSIEGNEVVEVNSRLLEKKLIEEHTHLTDDKIMGESKGLTGEHTVAKKENLVENNEEVSENYNEESKILAEDKMLNATIKEVNEESESNQKSEIFKDGKIDYTFTDNTHKENKQFVETPSVKDSTNISGDAADKNIIEISYVDPKNGEIVDASNNKIIKTEVIQKVEIMSSTVNLLNNGVTKLNQNTTNEDEIQVEEKVPEQSINHTSTFNNSELNKINETNAEKSNKPDSIDIMVVSGTTEVLDSDHELNALEITENVANTINIDKNRANDNLATTNNADSIDAFHINTDKAHSTEKFPHSKEDLIQVSENSTHNRNKRSIEKTDEHIEPINDYNETEKSIAVNAGNVSKEEIFENDCNDEQKDNVSDQKLIVDKDNNTSSDPATISSNKENESSNKQELMKVTKTVNVSTDNVKLNHNLLENNIGNSVPDIVDMKILQNNAELMILSHSDNDNTKTKATIEEMEEKLNKPTYDVDDIDYKGVFQKPETGSPSDTKVESTGIKTSDEELYDSSDKRSITVEDKEIKKSDTDDNKLKTSESMDLETAAITIQKAFQAFLFESTASNSEDIENDGNSMDTLEGNMTAPGSSTDPTNTGTNESVNERRLPGLLTRTNTMLQTVNEEKSLSLSTDESSGLSSAATVIQAHVRGFLVRNRLSFNKLTSSDTPANSDEATSEDAPRANFAKTVLKINIPEQDNYASIGDSIDTSIDLPIDPVPSVVNLHPLGYDKDARKPLKREDAIQSISPPSNGSLKLSEEVYSPLESSIEEKTVKDKDNNEIEKNNDENKTSVEYKKKAITRASSDEMDVVTPYSGSTQLLHSSEFHDVLLPTQVVRTDSTVVRGE